MEATPCPNCGGYCPKPNGENLVFPICRYPRQMCGICGGFNHLSDFHEYYMARINLITANNLAIWNAPYNANADGSSADGNANTDQHRSRPATKQSSSPPKALRVVSTVEQDQQHSEEGQASQNSYQLNPISSAANPNYDPKTPTSSTNPATPTKDSGDRQRRESLRKADAFLESLGSELMENEASPKMKLEASESTSPNSISPDEPVNAAIDGDTIMSGINHKPPPIPSIFHKQKALDAISQGRRVYVGNLDPATTASELPYMFPDCEDGSAVLVPDNNDRGVFLSYSTASHARVVVVSLDGQKDRFGGLKHWTAQIVHPSYIQKSVEMASTSCKEGRRLYIGNLDPATTELDLAVFFKDYKIEMISIPCEPGTDRPSGYAFVSFLSTDDAESAIAPLKDELLLNNIIHIRLSRPTPEELASQAEKSQLRADNLARAAELRRRLEMAKAQRLIANQSSPSPAITPVKTAPTGPRSINNLSIRGHATLVSPDVNCDICPGKHQTFSHECPFLQDTYAVALKLDRTLSSVYNGPKKFRGYADLLKYDLHERGGGPKIRWPFPKKLARDMSDEQFSLILLDVLSYTLPDGVSDEPSKTRPLTDVKPVVKLPPIAPNRRLSDNLAKVKPVAQTAQAPDPSSYPKKCPKCTWNPRMFEDQDTLEKHDNEKHRPNPNTIPVTRPQIDLQKRIDRPFEPRAPLPATQSLLLCPRCPDQERRFKDSTAMLQHLVGAHTIPVEKNWIRPNSKNRLFCNFCPVIGGDLVPFKGPNDLAQHVAVRHAVEAGLLPPVGQSPLKRKQDDSIDIDDRKRPRVIGKEEKNNERVLFPLPTKDLDPDRKISTPVGSGLTAWGRSNKHPDRRRLMVSRERSPSPLPPRMLDRERSRSPRSSRMLNRERSRSPCSSRMLIRERSRSPISSRMLVPKRSRSPLVSRMLARNRSRSPIASRRSVAQENNGEFGNSRSHEDEARRQAWRRERDATGSSARDGERSSPREERAEHRERDARDFSARLGERGSPRNNRSRRRKQAAASSVARDEAENDKKDRDRRVNNPLGFPGDSYRPALPGKYFDSPHGGSYYNGEAKIPTKSALKEYRPTSSHYSPSPPSKKLEGRSKEDQSRPMLRTSLAGLRSVPTMPKSMRPSRASEASLRGGGRDLLPTSKTSSQHQEKDAESGKNKENQKSNIYDDKFWEEGNKIAIKKSIKVEEGRLRRDWDDEML